MGATSKSPLNRLWELISLEKKEISSIYFYAILGGLVNLSVPLGVQAIIGFVLGASMATSIYVLIVLVVLGVLLVGIFQINQMKIIEKIQQQIFTRYAFEFAEKIPRFDLKSIDGLHLPETINRFFDTLNLQKGLSKLLLDIPTALIQIVFGLILLALYHPTFIVFGFVLIGILWLILSLTSNKGLSTSYKESSYKYAVVAWLGEMARVIKSFKFSQGTDLNLLKTDKNVLGYLTARTAHFHVLLFQYRTLVAFKVIITLAMLTVGTFLLLNQQLNIGEFIAAEIVILSVIAAVEKLISSLDSVYDVITALEKLASVTEIHLEKEGKLPLPDNKQGVSIALQNFSFGYPNQAPLFSNLNVGIGANQTVCVSGKPGTGKSSFLRMLSGSYNNFEGNILLNDIPIGNYLLQSLRSNIGMYDNQQDIFTGTLLENISLGRAETDPQHIMAIAKTIGIEDFIKTMPQGFDTEIDPSGKQISGSNVKKILLLRALASRPQLLLLEDPWEGMAEEVRENIINYLLNNTPNTTVLVASNDTDFAQRCVYKIEV